MFPLFLSLLSLAAPADQPAPGTNRVIAVDVDWLRRRGNGPFVLDQPRTTYLLKVNVCVPGTAFVVNAPDVVLDLGGHEVVYGDTAPLEVRNGSFEEGTGRQVPGWDLKDAPAAELAPNTRCLFGKQVLRLKEFRAPQRVVSDPIPIPPGAHSHAATITPAGGDYRIGLTLTVMDADSGRKLGHGKSNNVERGIAAVAHFTPGPSKAVRLVIEAVPRPGQTETLDLDLATLGTSFDYGVLATNLWTGQLPGWGNLERAVGQGRRNVSSVTVRNGTIRQGPGRPLGGSPLFLVGARGIAVENVHALTNGIDTTTLNAAEVRGPVTVRGCRFTHDVENITDRGRSISAICLGGAVGPIRVEDNTLEKLPQVGILLNGNRSGAPIRIAGNRISLHTLVTNGYALIVVGARNFEIADNRITATNGRGILIDCYRKEPTENGRIHHNYVEVREALNREYPTRMEARALRMRNLGEAPHRDLVIADNTLIATTGPGLCQEAFGAILTYTGKNGSLAQTSIRFERNVMQGVSTLPEPKWLACGLLLDGYDAGLDIRFRDNVLESNVAALALANTQGPVGGLKFTGNTFRHVEAEGGRSFHAVRAGFWTFPVENVSIIGPHLENHPDLDVEWVGSGKKGIAFGYLLNVTVRRGGAAVAGAEVVVEDREAKVVYQGTTDVHGTIAAVPVTALRHRQTTPDPRQIATDERGPFRVRAGAGGKSVTKEIRLSGNADIVLELPRP